MGRCMKTIMTRSVLEVKAGYKSGVLTMASEPNPKRLKSLASKQTLFELGEPECAAFGALHRDNSPRRHKP